MPFKVFRVSISFAALALLLAVFAASASAQGRTGGVPQIPGRETGSPAPKSEMTKYKRDKPLAPEERDAKFAQLPRTAEVLGVSQAALVSEFDALHARNRDYWPVQFVADKVLVQVVRERHPQVNLTVEDLFDGYRKRISPRQTLVRKGLTEAQYESARDEQRRRLAQAKPPR